MDKLSSFIKNSKKYHVYCPKMNKMSQNNELCYLQCSGSSIPSVFGHVCLQMVLPERPLKWEAAEYTWHFPEGTKTQTHTPYQQGRSAPTSNELPILLMQCNFKWTTKTLCLHCDLNVFTANDSVNLVLIYHGGNNEYTDLIWIYFVAYVFSLFWIISLMCFIVILSLWYAPDEIMKYTWQ